MTSIAKIPFGLLPGHWGLKGKTRERARVEYELLPGEEQDKALAVIDHSDNEDELKKVLLRIDLKYNKISKYEYEVKLAELSFDKGSKSLSHKLLSIDFEFDKIIQLEYEKRLAAINEEPWVAVKNTEFNASEGPGGLSFELEWNEHFIKFLQDNGFGGLTDESTVDSWFTELCKSIIAEDEAGDSFSALQAQLHARSAAGQIVNKIDLDGDNTEYS